MPDSTAREAPLTGEPRAVDNSTTGRSRDEALRVVCEVAFQWAGEYGFAIPERATEVWDAAKLLRPDLEPTDDD